MALFVAVGVGRLLHQVGEDFASHLQLAQLSLLNLFLGVAVDQHVSASVNDLRISYRVCNGFRLTKCFEGKLVVIMVANHVTGHVNIGIFNALLIP